MREEHSEDCRDHEECDKVTQLLTKANEFSKRAFMDYTAYCEVKLGVDPLTAFGVWAQVAMLQTEKMKEAILALKIAKGDVSKFEGMFGISGDDEKVQEIRRDLDERIKLWKMEEGIE